MQRRIDILITLTAFASLLFCAACGLHAPGESDETVGPDFSATPSIAPVLAEADIEITDALSTGDGTGPGVEGEPEPPDQMALALVADSILARMNVRRAIDGLPSIVSHDVLRDIATLRSQDMAVRGYLSHQDPNSGQTPAEAMMNSASFSGRLAEVVFLADHTLANLPAVTVAAWLESPANRSVVMDPIYHVGAVGIASGVDGWIVTLLLAERSP